MFLVRIIEGDINIRVLLRLCGKVIRTERLAEFANNKSSKLPFDATLHLDFFMLLRVTFMFEGYGRIMREDIMCAVYHLVFVPKYAPQIRIWHIWTYLGTYLSVPNMVKWGVPENAVQTR